MTIDDILKSKEWQYETKMDRDLAYAVYLVLGDIEFKYRIPPATENFSNSCPVCRMGHDVHTPHFPNAIWVGNFIKEHWRIPHWCDLVGCCAPEIQEKVRDYLEARGQWSVPKDGLDLDERVARELGDLPVHSLGIDPNATGAAVSSNLEAALGPFVNSPNTEELRAAMTEAATDALKKSGIEAQVVVRASPTDPSMIETEVIFAPKPAAKEMRVMDIFVRAQDWEEEGKD